MIHFPNSLHQAYTFINSWLSPETWGTIEIFISIIIFFLCLYIRVIDPLFNSQIKYSNSFRIKLRLSQIGLFMQSFIAALALVDGYDTIFLYDPPHILFIFLLFNCLFLKAYMLICVQERKKLFKKENYIPGSCS